MRLSLDKDYFQIRDNKLYDRLDRHWFDVEELYKEEEYNFLKRFGNIQRIDTLSMPLERDIRKGNIYPFTDKIGRRLVFYYDLLDKNFCIKDVCANKTLFDTTLYIELCKMCENLFK